MSELLRVYAPEECGATGYPIAWEKSLEEVIWGGPKVANSYETVIHPKIKDYVRELAGHRCVRCHHPYPPGIAKTHPRGEWTPCDERCSHQDDAPVRVIDRKSRLRALYRAYNGGLETARAGWLADDAPLGVVLQAQWRILTVHHLTGEKADCRWWNLAALCQRCHLTIQGRVVMERAFILEHSDWFKPYAAGWYAAKYLDENLSREETMARLDELLALELMGGTNGQTTR